MLFSRQKYTAEALDDILSHWLWATLILLAVFYFGIREIDKYPPSIDEFRSLYHVGVIIDGPNSPLDVLDSLAQHSPGQMPLYYLLLNIWVQITSEDIAIARILSLLCVLLAHAMLYRLASDFVAPAGGIFALALAASNTFLNFQVANARMYALQMLATAWALWLYLHIMYRLHEPRLRDYATLTASVLVLASSHAASMICILAVGLFHLAAPPRGKRWWRVLFSVIVSIVLTGPWIHILLIQDLPTYQQIRVWHSTNNIGAIFIGLLLQMLNNYSFMLLFPLLGIVIAWRRQHINIRGYHLLILYYIPALLILEQVTSLLSEYRLRYALPGFYLFYIFAALGVFALYRVRRWTVLLVSLWILTGVSYQQSELWDSYVTDRNRQLHQIPYHAIDRIAEQTDERPSILVSYRSTAYLIKQEFGSIRHHDYYLPGVPIMIADDFQHFEQSLRNYALTTPAIWLAYHEAKVADEEAEVIAAEMQTLDYTLCAKDELAGDALLLRYSWRALACEAPQALLSASNAHMGFELHGVAPGHDGNSLLFSDSWQRLGDANTDDLRISYQLFDAAEQKAAQLDLPLVHEGMPRQFSLDTAGAPPGMYRLVAIVYNHETGERIPWERIEAGDPDMLPLAEVELPGA